MKLAQMCNYNMRAGAAKVCKYAISFLLNGTVFLGHARLHGLGETHNLVIVNLYKGSSQSENKRWKQASTCIKPVFRMRVQQWNRFVYAK